MERSSQTHVDEKNAHKKNGATRVNRDDERKSGNKNEQELKKNEQKRVRDWKSQKWRRIRMVYFLLSFFLVLFNRIKLSKGRERTHSSLYSREKAKKKWLHRVQNLVQTENFQQSKWWKWTSLKHTRHTYTSIIQWRCYKFASLPKKPKWENYVHTLYLALPLYVCVTSCCIPSRAHVIRIFIILYDCKPIKMRK